MKNLLSKDKDYRLTVDPTDNDQLKECDYCQGECAAVPIHDGEKVDTALSHQRQGDDEFNDAHNGREIHLPFAEVSREFVDKRTGHRFEHAELAVQTDCDQHAEEEDCPEGRDWEISDGFRVGDECETRP